MTGQAIRKWIPALTVLALAASAGAQERSDEYEQGYRDGYSNGVRDAICPLLEAVSPLLPTIAPMLDAGDPETGMQEVAIVAGECGIESFPAAQAAAPPPSPEPPSSARCQRLAALLVPLDAQVDRMLAGPNNDQARWDLAQVRMRRSEIESEMALADC